MRPRNEARALPLPTRGLRFESVHSGCGVSVMSHSRVLITVFMARMGRATGWRLDASYQSQQDEEGLSHLC